jgi:hypothetical protein
MAQKSAKIQYEEAKQGLEKLEAWRLAEVRREMKISPAEQGSSEPSTASADRDQELAV